MKKRIAVRAIIPYRGKILAVRLKSRNGEEKEFWCTVGGGVYDGEDLHTAINREIVEETGVQPDVGRLLFIQQFYEELKDTESLEFFYLVKNPQDFLDIDLDKTTHGNIEIAEIDFINPEELDVRPAFLRTIDYENLPERTEIFNYL